MAYLSPEILPMLAMDAIPVHEFRGHSYVVEWPGSRQKYLEVKLVNRRRTG